MAFGSKISVIIVCSLLLMSLAIMMPPVSLAAEYELDLRNVEDWMNMDDMDYYLGNIRDHTYNYQHPRMLWPDFKGFRVGDVLILKYNNQLDHIAEVPPEDVFFCTPTHPIAVYSSGFDRLLLDEPGDHSFISTVPDHCNGGQQFSLYVNPAPAPAPVPHTPSPSPVASSPNPTPEESTSSVSPSLQQTSSAFSAFSFPAVFASLALFFSFLILV